MSKGPWKPETKQKHKAPPPRHKRPPVALEPDGIMIDPPASRPAPDQPAPLPLIGAPDTAAPGLEAAPAAAGGQPVFDEAATKKAIGATFCGLVKSPIIANVASRITVPLGIGEVEFEPVEPETGETWAESAYPCWKLIMAKYADSPWSVLAVTTATILVSKMKTKKKEVHLNVVTDGNQGNA